MTAPRTLLPLSSDTRARLSGRPCVVMLDVDGTLAPIAPRPEDAHVPPETRRAVAALVSHPAAHVALVSGRSAEDARRMVGVDGVWAVGNHGAESVAPDGTRRVDERVAPFEGAIREARIALAELLAPVAGAMVEDKRWTLSVHYRLVDPSLVPALQSTVDRVASEHGLRVHQGKMVCEVRPPVAVDKGTAVLSLAESLGGLDDSASVVFMGDDRTDEDAFQVLRLHVPGAVTVRVAEDVETPAAEFVVPNPAAVTRFLEELGRLMEGE